MTTPGGDGADPAELLALAVTAAVEAAGLVSRGREGAAEHVATKSSPVDVVTAVDAASEELLVSRLLGARPDDGVLGEEGASREGTSGVRWIVDPIDGTVNFLYDIPAYAVSVAAEVHGVVRAGVVLNVATGERFTATAGGGAWLAVPGRSDRRLAVTGPPSLDRTLVATGFGYQAEQRRAQGQVVARLLPRVRDIRRCGSAAVDLCSVAAGRVDAYYERGLNPWDHAAGALVAAEAGAVVSGLPGTPPGRPMVIAAAPSISGPFGDLVAELHR